MLRTKSRRPLFHPQMYNAENVKLHDLWKCFIMPAKAISLNSSITVNARFRPILMVFQDKHIGLVTNPLGVIRNLETTIDALHAAPGVMLVVLFGPEHGICGEATAGEKFQSDVDPRSGLVAHSIYPRHK